MAYNDLIVDRLGGFTISADASAIADDAGVDDFLTDGVKDIIENCRKYKPHLLPLFGYASSTGSTANRELQNMDLLNVTAQFSSVKYPARFVSANEFFNAGISGSIYTATTTDPIFTIRNKTAYVLPTGGEDYVFDILLPGSVNASSAPSSSNPSNFPTDLHYLITIYGAIKVLSYIALSKAKDASTHTATAATKIGELFATTSDHPDIPDIQDALDKAKAMIDESSMGGGEDNETAQYWLLDEDTDMVSSTISVAAQEISRASSIMAAIDKKTASLTKYTDLVAVLIQDIQAIVTMQNQLTTEYRAFFIQDPESNKGRGAQGEA